MPRPTDSAYRKIARARDHLKVFRGEVIPFTKSVPSPYGVITEIDDKGIGHVRFEVRQKIPVSWSLMVGDVIHNARSALDHLVYQLAIANGGSGETNAFPFYDDPQKYRDNKARLLKHVIEPARTEIERLQPYNVVCTINPRAFAPGFERHMYLYMLGRLDDLDKHRLLLAGSAATRTTEPKFKGVRRAKGEWAGEGKMVSVEQGTELFTITELEPLGDPNDVKMYPEPTYSIGFGDPEFTAEQLWTDKSKGYVGLADLEEGIKAAEQTIASFERFFP